MDLENHQVYKIKHLHKVEVASSDPSGCTFILVCAYRCLFLAVTYFAKLPPVTAKWTLQRIVYLFCATQGFDNLKSQSISPPQWTLRNKDDRWRINCFDSIYIAAITVAFVYVCIYMIYLHLAGTGCWCVFSTCAKSCWVASPKLLAWTSSRWLSGPRYTHE
jgi:hypothetical protein